MGSALVTLQPERFVAGGDAMARDADGRVVFVRGGLPGETVAVEITTNKRDWARGHVVDVLEASPQRVVEPCTARHAGCGGCGWQHLDLDAQRAAKRSVVVDALQRIGGVTDADVTIGPGVSPDGYRTTIRLSAGADGAAGFRSERSHDVVAAPHCLVAHEALRAVVGDLRLDADVDLTLRYSAVDAQLGARWDKSRGRVAGLPEGVLVGAGAVLHETIDGHRLQVSLGSFFQSGPQAASLLVAAVRRAAPELETATHVVDAYAGVGLFGVAATTPTAHVVAIETSRSSSADAAVNLAGRPSTIVRGEVGGWRAAAGSSFDVIIADPARSGLGVPGTTALARIESPVIVLVSCDAASLGRDVKLLAERHYRLAGVELIDAFPHTTQIEAVSRFEFVPGRQLG